MSASSNFAISITDNALRRVCELIKAENKSECFLRISVDGGGCSGFRYNYDLTTLPQDDDFIIEKLGAKIAIDSVSQEFLNGCIVDFIEELGTSYFQIKNPNATAKCGCGNSFSI